MCGIFGFVGKNPDYDLLSQVATLAGTRGPHSWGQAWVHNGNIWCRKFQGKVLEEKLQFAHALIGHARLATSGDLTLENAQPIIGPEMAIVHNGNVYNHQEIFNLYSYSPKTANDSEAIIPLLMHGSPQSVLELVDRKSPLAVLAIDREQVIAIRRGHPLFVLSTDDGVYFCSRRFADAAEFPDNSFEFYEVAHA